MQKVSVNIPLTAEDFRCQALIMNTNGDVFTEVAVCSKGRLVCRVNNTGFGSGMLVGPFFDTVSSESVLTNIGGKVRFGYKLGWNCVVHKGLGIAISLLLNLTDESIDFCHTSCWSSPLVVAVAD
jgi:hypothetical protein